MLGLLSFPADGKAHHSTTPRGAPFGVHPAPPGTRSGFPPIMCRIFRDRTETSKAEGEQTQAHGEDNEQSSSLKPLPVHCPSPFPNVVDKPQGKSLQADLLTKLHCLALPMCRPDNGDNCVFTDQIGDSCEEALVLGFPELMWARAVNKQGSEHYPIGPVLLPRRQNVGTCSYSSCRFTPLPFDEWRS